ncbi:MAG TPA: zinc-binding dehydrogenase [Stellaceae bacterium]|nr:zinc-binding dehydrogenase [Stellaceae bacterium]
MQAAIMVPGEDGGRWDIRDVQRPLVGAGQILARVHAASLNRAEMRAMHNLRLDPGKPAPVERAAGGDAAGEVVGIGADVSGFKPGDRIMGRCSGGFAEYAVIDAREAMPMPEALSWEEAACVPIVFVVVHDALYASAQLRAGETVLVTAASSGVGVATLLLGKLIGARVIGTSRSAEKLERLKGYGLDAGILTGSEGFAAAIAPVIGAAGVDMIVDNIGGDVFPACLEALAVGGRFVTIGRMSGVLKGELDLDRLALRRLHLCGVSNRLRNSAQRAESTRRFVADLLPALRDGRLRPIVDRIFPLSEIAAAQAHLEADRHVGKVVIRI